MCKAIRFSEYTTAVRGKVRAIDRRLKGSLEMALSEGFRPTNRQGHQGRRGDGAFQTEIRRIIAKWRRRRFWLFANGSYGQQAGA